MAKTCSICKDIQISRKDAAKARLHGFLTRDNLTQEGDPIIKNVSYGTASRICKYVKMSVNTYKDNWVEIGYGDEEALYNAYTAVETAPIDTSIDSIVHLDLSDRAEVKEVPTIITTVDTKEDLVGEDIPSTSLENSEEIEEEDVEIKNENDNNDVEDDDKSEEEPVVKEEEGEIKDENIKTNNNGNQYSNHNHNNVQYYSKRKKK